MSELNASFEKMVKEIAASHQWDFQSGGDGCVLTLETRQGRKQQVRVSTGIDHLQNPTVVISSKVGALKDVAPERALRANAKTSYGALAAVGEDIIMRGTAFVGESAFSAKELSAMIRHIALYADHMERELYGKEDRF